MQPFRRVLLAASAATVAVLFAATAARRYRLVRKLKSILRAAETRYLAACVPHDSIHWFDGLQQRITSASTNSVDQDPSSWSGPAVYDPPTNIQLPFPSIPDNTEGIAGLEDLVRLGVLSPKRGATKDTGLLVLNLGGGAFDGPATWLEIALGAGTVVLTADPFRRSEAHNLDVQHTVEANGGADVVLSISVLNVIAEPRERMRHVRTAHRALRAGGIFAAKIWAGCFPERGTGWAHTDQERGTHQNNAWALAYVPEVAAVFGTQVYCEASLNLIVAVKT